MTKPELGHEGHVSVSESIAMAASEHSDVPPSDANAQTPLWLRIKRWIIGTLGVGSMAWAIFATYMVFAKRKIDESWLILLLILVIFLCGIFATWIALRGTDKEVKEFNLIP